MVNNSNDNKKLPQLLHDELPAEHDDPLIRRLHLVIRFTVKVLAVLMVLVIIWSVFDVVYVLYSKFIAPPFFCLKCKTSLLFLVPLWWY